MLSSIGLSRSYHHRFDLILSNRQVPGVHTWMLAYSESLHVVMDAFVCRRKIIQFVSQRVSDGCQRCIIKYNALLLFNIYKYLYFYICQTHTTPDC